MRSLRRLAQILLGLARELSDESAYQRHLKHHGRTHSGAEWRAFSDGRLKAKFTRPKCC